VTPTRRRVSIALSTAALLAALAAGCPLPQPMAEVARIDGGTISPPRIVAESAVPTDTIVLVSRGCSTALFSLGVEVEDVDTTEAVAARWFVDFRPDVMQVPLEQPVPAANDPTNPIRVVQPYAFQALPTSTSTPLHVVEVVISNAFQPISTTSSQQNLSAQPGFETAVFRWVFQYVDATDPRGRCN
jgi:hypothetical protein